MPLLVGTLVPRFRRPVHREDLFFGPDEFFRVAMTFEAPFHVERGNLISQRHEINASVTGRAADTLVDVNAVIEISEVGEIVHSGPLDRLSRPPTLADGFQVGAIGPDLRVAVHAGLGRGYACEAEFLNGRVTVAAIYAVIADMMFVAELNRLLA